MALYKVICLAMFFSLLGGCRLKLREEPWHEPVANNDLPALQSLVSHGMRIDSEDENGDTPLAWSLARDHRKMARYLILRGADPYHLNKRGETAIQRGQASRPSGENVEKWLQNEGLLVRKR